MQRGDGLLLAKVSSPQNWQCDSEMFLQKALEGTLGGCINSSTCSIMSIAKNPTQLNLIKEFPRQHLPNVAI